MNPFLYYALQFVLGGGSVVGITLIAKYIDPKYTGIIYALPVILITAAIFIYLQQGLDVTKATVKSTFVYEFTLIYFIFAFYFLLGKMDFWWALLISFFSWAIIATLLQFLFKL